ncbi:MAG: hypothetical protein ABJA81_04985 [Nocardioidaceae bacterium]
MLRERWRRTDPLTSVVGAIAAMVYALHGFNGLLSRDLAVYSYAGQQVVDGVPPYIGILNRAGPLAHFVPAIGVAAARAFGFDDLLGIRLLCLVISVACVSLVYILGRDLFASPLAGLAAAAAFLSFSGFIEYASNGPREKTSMVLFLLCALLAVSKQRWFAAGFCLSLATLVWQPAFLVGLTAMVVAVLAVRPSERLRALVGVAVGGLVPAAICLLYFAVVGALHAFFDAFLLINARYTVPTPLTSHLAANWERLQSGYGLSLWVMLVGLVALAILSLLVIARKDWRRDPASMSVVAFGAAGFVGVIWTFRDFNGWPDVFVLLPLAAIGIGGLSKAVAERLPTRGALCLTLAWVVATVALAATYAFGERDDRLELQRDSVVATLEQLPPDASILSIKAPQALVLSGKTNPTRHQMFTLGLNRYVDDTWPGGLTGFGNWVGREQPTLITLGGEVPPWLADTISTKYRRVGAAPGWTWYVSRSVGPVVTSALHDAISPMHGQSEP